jgi:hypothetical protein
MRKPLVFALLFFTGCNCGGRVEEAYDPRCFTPCYGGDPQNAGKGICTLGTWDCPFTMAEPTCMGWVAPQKPQCNGLDNDCDGQIDVGMWTVCYTGDAGTEDVGPCHGGFSQCLGQSSGPCVGEVTPIQETCNGIDDDCDGVVDDIPPMFCYTGPPNTAGVGLCHPGTEECVRGVAYCKGEQTPQPDVCDGIDHECNGAPETPSIDVCFMIDLTDGRAEDSFADYLPGTLAALDMYLLQNQSSNMRYCVVGMPAPTDGGAVPYTQLMQDFSDATTTRLFIDSLAPTSHSDELGEPTDNLDDLWSMATGGLSPSWRSGSQRYLVMFTADEAESDDGIPIALVAQTLGTVNMNVVLFVSSTYQSTFSGLTPALFPLAAPPITLQDISVSIPTTCDAGS